MKLFAKTHFCPTMFAMHKQTALFTLIVCVASAFAVTARAQGRLSQSQTELSSTTISGSVQCDIFCSFQHPNGVGNGLLQEFFHHQRNVSTSLSPIPPINFGGLIIVPVGADYPTGEEFYSAGADLMEASRPTALIDQPVMPLIPPTPSQDSSSLFQSSSFVLMSIDSFYSQSASSSGSVPELQTSSLTIQAVPEPSAFALGGLALGLIAIMRISQRKGTCRC
jgi:hypothetical protein